MCGIVGFITQKRSLKADQMELLVARMADTLRHRGPDDSGVWADLNAGVALGHRRLSIIDLSAHGHQPMVSLDGRYVIVFNGEVYNFRALRSQLEAAGFVFRGTSDTEVMLAAIGHYGLVEALAQFNGMFAFALWDRSDKVLHLCRDRLGEKPLYYGRVGMDFVFASELKAFCQYPGFKPEVDRKALELYLQYAYVPAPYSIYKDIVKLPPGSIVTISHFFQDGIPESKPYWSACAIVEKAQKDRFQGDFKAAGEQLEVLLKDAVKLRMESDVPLGVFLSGGIDSSLISALMQEQSARPVKTFTIGFHEKDYNEAGKAKEIARHLQTEHTDLYVRPGDSLALIPRLADIYDEPFADSSQIATYLVSKLTREHVTVALSGDGGDEVFGGYNRYFWGNNIWNKIKGVPYPFRRFAAQTLTAISPNVWDAMGHLLPGRFNQKTMGHKIHKLAGVLDVDSPQEMYFKLASFWDGPSVMTRKDQVHHTVPFSQRTSSLAIKNFPEWMMCMDLITYLPDDIFVKVDRASMAASLEARAVFLDHRVVEMAFSLPLAFKVSGYQGKGILRGLLDSRLPRKFFEGPKMGFGIPLDAWLRGPLRPWAENLLDEKSLAQDGFFDPGQIRKKWNEHVSGRRNWQYHLWIILMFQLWKQRWLECAHDPA